MCAMQSDADIARATKLKPIVEVAANLGVPDHACMPVGQYKAKIDLRTGVSWAGQTQGNEINRILLTPSAV